MNSHGGTRYGHFWTPEDDARIAELWPDKTTDEIAAEFNTTKNAICGRVRRMGGLSDSTERRRRIRELKEQARLAAKPKPSKQCEWPLTCRTPKVAGQLYCAEHLALTKSKQRMEPSE